MIVGKLDSLPACCMLQSVCPCLCDSMALGTLAACCLLQPRGSFGTRFWNFLRLRQLICCLVSAFGWRFQATDRG
jgi:hypothetical protein